MLSQPEDHPTESTTSNSRSRRSMEQRLLTSEWPVAFAAEAIGRRMPLVMLPSVNSALAAHPQFERSVETLRGAGMRVLYGEGEFVPKAPKESDRAAYPSEVAQGAVARGRWSRPGWWSRAIVQAFWGQSVRPCPDRIAEEAVRWDPSR